MIQRYHCLSSIMPQVVVTNVRRRLNSILVVLLVLMLGCIRHTSGQNFTDVPCTNPTCTIYCPYGYYITPDGCETCQCIEPCQNVTCSPGEVCIPTRLPICGKTPCLNATFFGLCNGGVPEAIQISSTTVGTSLSSVQASTGTLAGIPTSGSTAGNQSTISTTAPSSVTMVSGIQPIQATIGNANSSQSQYISPPTTSVEVTTTGATHVQPQVTSEVQNSVENVSSLSPVTVIQITATTINSTGETSAGIILPNSATTVIAASVGSASQHQVTTGTGNQPTNINKVVATVNGITTAGSINGNSTEGTSEGILLPISVTTGNGIGTQPTNTNRVTTTVTAGVQTQLLVTAISSTNITNTTANTMPSLVNNGATMTATITTTESSLIGSVNSSGNSTTSASTAAQTQVSTDGATGVAVQTASILSGASLVTTAVEVGGSNQGTAILSVNQTTAIVVNASFTTPSLANVPAIGITTPLSNVTGLPNSSNQITTTGVAAIEVQVTGSAGTVNNQLPEPTTTSAVPETETGTIVLQSHTTNSSTVNFLNELTGSTIINPVPTSVPNESTVLGANTSGTAMPVTGGQESQTFNASQSLVVLTTQSNTANITTANISNVQSQTSVQNTRTLLNQFSGPATTVPIAINSESITAIGSTTIGTEGTEVPIFSSPASNVNSLSLLNTTTGIQITSTSSAVATIGNTASGARTAGTSMSIISFINTNTSTTAVASQVRVEPTSASAPLSTSQINSGNTENAATPFKQTATVSSEVVTTAVPFVATNMATSIVNTTAGIQEMSTNTLLQSTPANSAVISTTSPTTSSIQTTTASSVAVPSGGTNAIHIANTLFGLTSPSTQAATSGIPVAYTTQQNSLASNSFSSASTGGIVNPFTASNTGGGQVVTTSVLLEVETTAIETTATQVTVKPTTTSSTLSTAQINSGNTENAAISFTETATFSSEVITTAVPFVGTNMATSIVNTTAGIQEMSTNTLLQSTPANSVAISTTSPTTSSTQTTTASSVAVSSSGTSVVNIANTPFGLTSSSTQAATSGIPVAYTTEQNSLASNSFSSASTGGIVNPFTASNTVGGQVVTTSVLIEVETTAIETTASQVTVKPTTTSSTLSTAQINSGNTENAAISFTETATFSSEVITTAVPFVGTNMATSIVNTTAGIQEMSTNTLLQSTPANSVAISTTSPTTSSTQTTTASSVAVSSSGTSVVNIANTPFGLTSPSTQAATSGIPVAYTTEQNSLASNSFSSASTGGIVNPFTASNTVGGQVVTTSVLFEVETTAIETTASQVTVEPTTISAFLSTAQINSGNTENAVISFTETATVSSEVVTTAVPFAETNMATSIVNTTAGIQEMSTNTLLQSTPANSVAISTTSPTTSSTQTTTASSVAVSSSGTSVVNIANTPFGLTSPSTQAATSGIPVAYTTEQNSLASNSFSSASTGGIVNPFTASNTVGGQVVTTSVLFEVETTAIETTASQVTVEPTTISAFLSTSQINSGNTENAVISFTETATVSSEVVTTAVPFAETNMATSIVNTTAGIQEMSTNTLLQSTPANSVAISTTSPTTSSTQTTTASSVAVSSSGTSVVNIANTLFGLTSPSTQAATSGIPVAYTTEQNSLASNSFSSASTGGIVNPFTATNTVGGQVVTTSVLFEVETTAIETTASQVTVKPTTTSSPLSTAQINSGNTENAAISFTETATFSSEVITTAVPFAETNMATSIVNTTAGIQEMSTNTLLQSTPANSVAISTTSPTTSSTQTTTASSVAVSSSGTSVVNIGNTPFGLTSPSTQAATSGIPVAYTTEQNSLASNSFSSASTGGIVNPFTASNTVGGQVVTTSVLFEVETTAIETTASQVTVKPTTTSSPLSTAQINSGNTENAAISFTETATFSSEVITTAVPFVGTNMATSIVNTTAGIQEMSTNTLLQSTPANSAVISTTSPTTSSTQTTTASSVAVSSSGTSVVNIANTPFGLTSSSTQAATSGISVAYTTEQNSLASNSFSSASTGGIVNPFTASNTVGGQVVTTSVLFEVETTAIETTASQVTVEPTTISAFLSTSQINSGNTENAVISFTETATVSSEVVTTAVPFAETNMATSIVNTTAGIQEMSTSTLLQSTPANSAVISTTSPTTSSTQTTTPSSIAFSSSSTSVVNIANTPFGLTSPSTQAATSGIPVAYTTEQNSLASNSFSSASTGSIVSPFTASNTAGGQVATTNVLLEVETTATGIQGLTTSSPIETSTTLSNNVKSSPLVSPQVAITVSNSSSATGSKTSSQSTGVPIFSSPVSNVNSSSPLNTTTGTSITSTSSAPAMITGTHNTFPSFAPATSPLSNANVVIPVTSSSTVSTPQTTMIVLNAQVMNVSAASITSTAGTLGTAVSAAGASTESRNINITGAFNTNTGTTAVASQVAAQNLSVASTEVLNTGIVNTTTGTIPASIVSIMTGSTTVGTYGAATSLPPVNTSILTISTSIVNTAVPNQATSTSPVLASSPFSNASIGSIVNTLTASNTVGQVATTGVPLLRTLVLNGTTMSVVNTTGAQAITTTSSTSQAPVTHTGFPQFSNQGSPFTNATITNASSEQTTGGAQYTTAGLPLYTTPVEIVSFTPVLNSAGGTQETSTTLLSGSPATESMSTEVNINTRSTTVSAPLSVTSMPLVNTQVFNASASSNAGSITAGSEVITTSIPLTTAQVVHGGTGSNVTLAVGTSGPVATIGAPESSTFSTVGIVSTVTQTTTVGSQSTTLLPIGNTTMSNVGTIVSVNNTVGAQVTSTVSSLSSTQIASAFVNTQSISSAKETTPISLPQVNTQVLITNISNVTNTLQNQFTSTSSPPTNTGLANASAGSITGSITAENPVITTHSPLNNTQVLPSNVSIAVAGQVTTIASTAASAVSNLITGSTTAFSGSTANVTQQTTTGISTTSTQVANVSAIGQVNSTFGPQFISTSIPVGSIPTTNTSTASAVNKATGSTTILSQVTTTEVPLINNQENASSISTIRAPQSSIFSTVGIVSTATGSTTVESTVATSLSIGNNANMSTESIPGGTQTTATILSQVNTQMVNTTSSNLTNTLQNQLSSTSSSPIYTVFLNASAGSITGSSTSGTQVITTSLPLTNTQVLPSNVSIAIAGQVTTIASTAASAVSNLTTGGTTALSGSTANVTQLSTTSISAPSTQVANVSTIGPVNSTFGTQFISTSSTSAPVGSILTSNTSTTSAVNKATGSATILSQVTTTEVPLINNQENASSVATIGAPESSIFSTVGIVSTVTQSTTIESKSTTLLPIENTTMSNVSTIVSVNNTVGAQVTSTVSSLSSTQIASAFVNTQSISSAKETTAISLPQVNTQVLITNTSNVTNTLQNQFTSTSPSPINTVFLNATAGSITGSSTSGTQVITTSLLLTNTEVLPNNVSIAVAGQVTTIASTAASAVSNLITGSTTAFSGSTANVTQQTTTGISATSTQIANVSAFGQVNSTLGTQFISTSTPVGSIPTTNISTASIVNKVTGSTTVLSEITTTGVPLINSQGNASSISTISAPESSNFSTVGIVSAGTGSTTVGSMITTSLPIGNSATISTGSIPGGTETTATIISQVNTQMLNTTSSNVTSTLQNQVTSTSSSPINTVFLNATAGSITGSSTSETQVITTNLPLTNPQVLPSNVSIAVTVQVTTIASTAASAVSNLTTGGATAFSGSSANVTQLTTTGISATSTQVANVSAIGQVNSTLGTQFISTSTPVGSISSMNTSTASIVNKVTGSTTILSQIMTTGVPLINNQENVSSISTLRAPQSSNFSTVGIVSTATGSTTVGSTVTTSLGIGNSATISTGSIPGGTQTTATILSQVNTQMLNTTSSNVTNTLQNQLTSTSSSPINIVFLNATASSIAGSSTSGPQFTNTQILNGSTVGNVSAGAGQAITIIVASPVTTSSSTVVSPVSSTTFQGSTPSGVQVTTTNISITTIEAKNVSTIALFNSTVGTQVTATYTPVESFYATNVTSANIVNATTGSTTIFSQVAMNSVPLVNTQGNTSSNATATASQMSNSSTIGMSTTTGSTMVGTQVTITAAPMVNTQVANIGTTMILNSTIGTPVTFAGSPFISTPVASGIISTESTPAVTTTSLLKVNTPVLNTTTGIVNNTLQTQSTSMSLPSTNAVVPNASAAGIVITLTESTTPVTQVINTGIPLKSTEVLSSTSISYASVPIGNQVTQTSLSITTSPIANLSIGNASAYSQSTTSGAQVTTFGVLINNTQFVNVSSAGSLLTTAVGTEVTSTVSSFQVTNITGAGIVNIPTGPATVSSQTATTGVSLISNQGNASSNVTTIAAPQISNFSTVSILTKPTGSTIVGSQVTSVGPIGNTQVANVSFAIALNSTSGTQVTVTSTSAPSASTQLTSESQNTGPTTVGTLATEASLAPTNTLVLNTSTIIANNTSITSTSSFVTTTLVPNANTGGIVNTLTASNITSMAQNITGSTTYVTQVSTSGLPLVNKQKNVSTTAVVPASKVTNTSTTEIITTAAAESTIVGTEATTTSGPIPSIQTGISSFQSQAATGTAGSVGEIFTSTTLAGSIATVLEVATGMLTNGIPITTTSSTRLNSTTTTAVASSILPGSVWNSDPIPGVTHTHYSVLICEGNSANLVCPTGSTISILSAFYGRNGSSTLCPRNVSSSSTLLAVDVSLPTAAQLLAQACNDQQQCTVAASSIMFGDPRSPSQARTPLYLTADYICQPAIYNSMICDNSSQLLVACPTNQTLEIISAFYGRDNLNTFCPTTSTTVTNCSNPLANVTVQTLCNGRSSCYIGTDILFSDPCPGVDKYLRIQYQCLDCVNAYGDDFLCQYMANLGYCNSASSEAWMTSNCRKACTRCETEPLPCINGLNDTQCNQLVASNECTTNPAYMYAYCRKTCLQCTDSLTQCTTQFGNDLQCTMWHLEDQCVLNPNWMFPYCTQSCFNCVDYIKCENALGNDDQCDDWAIEGQCTANPGFMVSQCYKSCFNCQSDPVCVNLYDDTWCEIWADAGQCDVNPLWMFVNCWKSCLQCETTAPVCVNAGNVDVFCESAALNGLCSQPEIFSSCFLSCSRCSPTPGVSNCVNLNDTECLPIAMNGECLTNPQMALQTCMKDCTSCEFISQQPVYIGGEALPGDISYETSGNMVILSDAFPLAARLMFFSAYFVTNSSVYLQIWRRTFSSSYPTLVYSQRVDPFTSNYAQTIPVNGCVLVNSGDQLGFTTVVGPAPIATQANVTQAQHQLLMRSSSSTIAFSPVALPRRFSLNANYLLIGC